MHHQDHWRSGHHGDPSEITLGVKGELTQTRIGQDGAINRQHGVTVCRRARHHLGTEHRAGARSVFDHNRLP